MSAIIFSMKSGSEMNIGEAMDFLSSHEIVAWGSNFRIIPEKFMASESNPLIGYVNHEGQVGHKVNIIEIIRYQDPKSYPNSNERPEEWVNAEWKTFFRFNKIEEFGPVETTSFKRSNGENVKHPPQNYVGVVD